MRNLTHTAFSDRLVVRLEVTSPTPFLRFPLPFVRLQSPDLYIKFQITDVTELIYIMDMDFEMGDAIEGAVDLQIDELPRGDDILVRNLLPFLLHSN